MWLPRTELRLHGLCSKHFTYLVHPVAPLFIILRQSISKFPTLELSILQPPQGLELQVCATRPRFKLCSCQTRTSVDFFFFYDCVKIFSFFCVLIPLL